MSRALFVMIACAACAPCAACGGSGGATSPDGGRDATGDSGGTGGDAPTGPACTAAPPAESGQATYYDADGTGACSFDAGSDYLIAAMNATDYGDAVWCGACVDVTGPMGHVVVRIVDECPGCTQGSLDLSETAFGMISPLSAGRVAITWQETECPVSGPITYHFQSGSSKDYTAIQLRDTRYPVASLESIDGSGAAHAIARTDDNYFVAAGGLGPGPYALRVTDQRGHVLEDTSVAFAPGGVTAGAAQFPVCP